MIFRTLGLGYANLGGLLMARGLGYDSDHGPGRSAPRSTAVMTGVAYCDFGRDGEGTVGALPVLCRESGGDAARHAQSSACRLFPPSRAMRAWPSCPFPLDADNCPDTTLVAAARRAWDQVIELGEAHGFRKRPIDRRGAHRDDRAGDGLRYDRHRAGLRLGQVQERSLAVGYFKIINRIVPEALQTLGYDESQIDEMIRYAVGHGTLATSPGIDH